MSKIHDPEVIGEMFLRYEPTDPDHAIRLRDLTEALKSAVPYPVYVVGVESPDGNVGNISYLDTTPPNSVISSFVSDSSEIVFVLRVGSKVPYTPPAISCFIDDDVLDYNHITFDADNGSNTAYICRVSITLPASGEVRFVVDTGSETSVHVTVDAIGPELATASVLALPYQQTAVKFMDMVSVAGAVQNAATSIELISEAVDDYTVTLGAEDSASPGLRLFAIELVISNAEGNLPVSLQAANALGTKGSIFNQIVLELDQSPPDVQLTLSSFSNSKPYLGFGDTVTATLTLISVDAMEFTFAHGTSDRPVDAMSLNRQLTVTESVFSETGGINVTANKRRNGITKLFTFDIPVASQELELESVSVQGSTLRKSSKFVPSAPLFGSSMNPRLSVEEILTLPQALPNTQDQDFFLDASAGYGYIAYPAALGRATFIDLSTGIVGGWDGATWPQDGSVGDTFGPLTVIIEDVEWYVYRTDYEGLVAPVLVSFQNPGLEVGEGEDLPHVQSSMQGAEYPVALRFNQPLYAAPQLRTERGVWVGDWVESADRLEWTRTLSVKDVDVRGEASFTDLIAESLSGEALETTRVQNFVVAGFERRTVQFSAFARSAQLGVTVFNSVRTKARYAGTTEELVLRSDTRDAAGSYSIVDENQTYVPSLGTHLWLSDAAFAGSNTSGTLQVEVEELP